MTCGVQSARSRAFERRSEITANGRCQSPLESEGRDKSDRSPGVYHKARVRATKIGCVGRGILRIVSGRLTSLTALEATQGVRGACLGVPVHELCHLKHRHHSAAFWSLVKNLLPDYEPRKLWLEEHGSGFDL